MKKKQINVELLLPVIVLLVILGSSGIFVRPTRNPDQKLPARIGDVWWNHELHARMKEYNCQVCHHTDRAGQPNPRECSDCHALLDSQADLVIADLYDKEWKRSAPPGGDQGPPAMEAFHAKCIGCHEAVSEGPTDCRDCHAQSFVGPHGSVAWNHREHSRQMDMECSDCHHKDLPESKVKKGDESGEAGDGYIRVAKTDGDYRPCSECHEPLEEMTVNMATGIVEHGEETHFDCDYCHTVDDPQVGVRYCQDCHAGIDPNPLGTPIDDRKPVSLEEAIHGRCLECHNEFNPDLRPLQMPGVCQDCHRASEAIINVDDMSQIFWSHKRLSRSDPSLGEDGCVICHHTDIPGEPHLSCYRCHDSENYEDIPSLTDALEGNCIKCHLETGQAAEKMKGMLSPLGEDMFLMKGKTSEGVVWWGHSFHANDLAFSCRECHHNMMKKDGLPYTACKSELSCPDGAGDPQPCIDCHASAEKPNRMSGQAAALSAPDLETAVHTTCLTCHERFKAGPMECEECHKK